MRLEEPPRVGKHIARIVHIERSESDDDVVTLYVGKAAFGISTGQHLVFSANDGTQAHHALRSGSVTVIGTIWHSGGRVVVSGARSGHSGGRVVVSGARSVPGLCCNDFVFDLKQSRERAEQSRERAEQRGAVVTVAPASKPSLACARCGEPEHAGRTLFKLPKYMGSALNCGDCMALGAPLEAPKPPEPIKWGAWSNACDDGES
jgi:hypothetical protein